MHLSSIGHLAQAAHTGTDTYPLTVDKYGNTHTQSRNTVSSTLSLLIVFMVLLAPDVGRAALLTSLPAPQQGVAGGLAMATTSPWLNPAAIALAAQRRDLFPAAWGGRILHEKDENALQKALDDYQQALNDYQSVGTDPTRELLARRLNRLSSAGSEKGMGATAELSLPQLPLALAAFLRGDYQARSAIHALGTADLTDPQAVEPGAVLRRHGLAQMVLGISLAKAFDGVGPVRRWSLGITPKMMLLRTSYAESELTDAQLRQLGGQILSDGKLNLDLGLLAQVGYDWRIAASLRNAGAAQMPFAGSQDIYYLDPEWNVGMAYRQGENLWNLDLVNPTERKQPLAQAGRLGGGLSREWGNWILRGGLFRQWQRHSGPGFTLGGGWRNRYLSLDAALVGHDEASAVSLQLTLKI